MCRWLLHAIGIPLEIDGVTGYLCEAGDVDSLTQSILRFYREPVAKVQAMIENAREHVRKHFDVMKIELDASVYLVR